MGTPQDPVGTFAPGLFNGRVALVTGGGRGIGKAVALAFARLGAKVVIAGRNGDDLSTAASEICALGAECVAVPMSIREVEQVDALVKDTLNGFGAIDFLINNAGGQFPARPSAISDRGWRAVIDLNLNGTWNMCSRVGPAMVERGFGAIVNIVHIYSFDRGAPNFVHSGAARAGVVNMTRSLAYYWARHGVTVNALAPGTVATQGVRDAEFKPFDQEDYEQICVQDIPSHRLASSEEMAAVCAFLCSPAARYVNGASIIADGAYYLGNWTPGLDPEMP